jgi:fumarate reductase flavoprotein subunit
MPSPRAPRRCRPASSRRPARPCSSAAGIQDSPAQFAADIQAKAHGTAAAHLVAAFSARIGAVLDTLQARHGITFEVLDGFLYPGHSVRRMHAVPQKTGAALVAQLERAATAAGADIVTQATVRELWVDGAGRITGVGYERPDGRIEHAALRRADPGLQRLRRQPGDGARVAARDG